MELYYEPITIINRVYSKDTTDKVEKWVKHEIKGYFKKKSISNINGNTVGIGTVIEVLIPFDDKFKQYKEWLANTELYYTLSQNDYIVRGTVSETLTSSNIVSTLANYEKCTVRTFEQTKQRYSFQKVQLKVEGV